ncbi:hypothetical protein ACFQPG_11215 [Sphingomonas sp. GCM10030256]|uniref:hypothetical protein n=1 Tax=Sphingomonas sp. GCM10030256 TaxID=3273427 RepID=UPI0036201D81
MMFAKTPPDLRLRQPATRKRRNQEPLRLCEADTAKEVVRAQAPDPPRLVLLAACGSTEAPSNLEAAAAQSDPAAAEVLQNAAEAGVNEQDALAAAGQAQVQSRNDTAFGSVGDGSAPVANSTVQARPNLPGSPNRKDGTQPPDKVDVAPR